MFSISGSKYSHTFWAATAFGGAILALFANLLLPGMVDLSTSSGSRIARRVLNDISHVYTLGLNSKENPKENSYEIQIFSWDPLVIIIQNFVSCDEITHLLSLSENIFEPSTVYRSDGKGVVDPDMRISESAAINRSDPGRRGNSEPLTVLRYHEGGEVDRDGYQGVTFKPIPGMAVYWENFHPNSSGHLGVYHAGLPVKLGVKTGINIWSFDTEVLV